MELIRGLQNLSAAHLGCVATIGNFDGVHRGHQAVLERLAAKARAYGLPALVILFEPQPQEYLRPATAPARLMRLREKIAVLSTQPVDRVLCLRFNAALAALEPEEFIDRIIVRGVGAKYLVVGDDFRYGRRRRGDFAMLTAAGMRYGFTTEAMATYAVDGERVSSTRVRGALTAGDLTTAERLLGRPYAISGRVMHGDKIGRRIGIPTANIALGRNAAPLHGIFVVQVLGVSDDPLPGVASIGTRPTVGGTKPLLEVHLFDFDRDIYREHITVQFLKKLRDERHFASVEAMAEQIRIDAVHAREFFDARPLSRRQ